MFTWLRLVSSRSSSCILCDTSIHQSSLCLCAECLNDLPIIHNSCPRCGTILYNNTFTPEVSSTSVECGNCQTNDLYIDHTFSLFQYKMPIDFFIKQVKFHHSLVIADLLGKLMVKNIIKQYSEQPSLPLPEAIIPIPLHYKRLRQRGYNQALEIARPLSKQLEIPIITNCLARNKYTRPQTDCSLKERKKNISNSFTATSQLPYKTIAIIDDVITTGATINEAAKVLKQQGVERVIAWSCANTNKNS